MAGYQRRSYHSHSPQWRNSRALKGSYVGIELELEAEQEERTGGYRQLLNLLPDIKSKGRPLVEADGSLSYTRGVELIFPPLRPASIKRANSSIKRVMKSLEGATLSPRATVGMHLNINTSEWSPHRILHATAAVMSLGGRFLAALGGRTLNRYCRLQPCGHGRELWSYCYNTHHAAVSIRDGRLELRFPKSTTDTDRLDRLLDFIHQLEEWSKKRTVTPDLPDWDNPRSYTWCGDDFKAYMATNKVGKRVLKYVGEH